MLFALDPTVQGTIAFLRRLRVKITSSTVNETLQNHPDWPSMLSISDALNKWHIPNSAGKIESVDIDNLPVPFIAATRRETPLVVVTAVDDKYVYLLYNNYRKVIKEKKDHFIKEWYGIYLIAEPGAHSGERDYKKAKQKQAIALAIPIVAAIVFTFTSTFSLLANIKIGVGSIASTATAIFVQYVITLAGLLITSLLIWYEIDKNNPWLQKVCTGIAKGNCTAILTGKASKLFGSVSWSEIGLFYFSGALLCLVFTRASMLPYLSLIALFNIAAAPYPIFSIYYQWKIAKQWCVLCIAIQAILIGGLINVLTNRLYESMNDMNWTVLVQGFVLYSLPVLVWFSIKPHILKLQEAKINKREFLRTKFNTEIFETLLRNQKKINGTADNLGINLGNPDAKNTLIKVCNPYCGACSTTHPEVEKLLEEIPDLRVKIIFRRMFSDDDKKPARHLLAIAEMKNESTLKKALDDWYLAPKKNYEEFAQKYPMNGELQLQENKMEAMQQWCEEVKIQYTPTFFINGHQLPATYSITDLKYFLLE